MTRKKANVNTFIVDEMRKTYLNAIHNRIARGKSVLITGKFGSGKSVLLSNISPPSGKVIWVNALGSPSQILGNILGINKPSPQGAFTYMQELVKQDDIIVIVDEVDLLKKSVYPYLKQCMDARIPFILAGKPDVESMLKEKFEDILSRLKVLRLQPLRVEAYKERLLNKAEPDAIDLMYGTSLGNMRRFEEILEDCLDFTRGELVKVETVMEFL